MDELVERVSTSAGIEPEAAQKAIGLILNFLLKEGPEDQVNKMIDAIPGARTAMSGAAVEEDGGSVLSGLTGGSWWRPHGTGRPVDRPRSQHGRNADDRPRSAGAMRGRRPGRYGRGDRGAIPGMHQLM